MMSLGGLKLADGGGAGRMWSRPLGGEAGRGVEATVFALNLTYTNLTSLAAA